MDQPAARLFLCVRCQKQTLICSTCDRGNTHCSKACSVASRREKQRASNRTQYSGLYLKLNEAKTAVESVFKRKFLEFSFWAAKGGAVRCRVATSAIHTFKDRVRKLTRRMCGRSIEQVIAGLRPFLRGWKAYFESLGLLSLAS